jgi:hypothetical protein
MTKRAVLLEAFRAYHSRLGRLQCPEPGLPTWLFRDILVQAVFQQGETDMGDKGKRDKGKREAHKKAQRTPEEKRRLKKEKKANKIR